MGVLSVRKGKPTHISILGGGTAGLSAGYYLRQEGLPFTIYEAKDRIGGNCVTFRHGQFLVDSGPHRFHDKDEVSTRVIKALLGDDLHEICAPSQIYRSGKFVDFPLVPLNLIRNLGLVGSARAGYQLLRSRWVNKNRIGKSLRDFAFHAYGETIAQRFLLDYSEKLWGTACEKLSATMAQTRLKGLDLQSFVKEAVGGGKAKSQHLDGSFYYPRRGIGMIPARLGESCGLEHIRTCSKVTRIVHGKGRIQSIVVNDAENIDVGDILSTLPLTYFLSIMDPEPDESIQSLGQGLRYRNLILVVLLLKRDSVSPNATVYFPESSFVFTRAYEPKNRSRLMSPPGHTSLALEIPCDPGDGTWAMRDEQLREQVLSQLLEIGWIKPEEVIGFIVKRIEHAYPVLEVDTEGKVESILEYLEGFGNLHIAGRNGRFAYTSIHELLRWSRDMVQGYVARCPAPGDEIFE
jgi:protoporphyrinogen oxidase